MRMPGFLISCTAVCLFAAAQEASAQGYGGPLTIQGVDHNTLHSASSRATGGTTLGITNDIGLMFANPAMLQSLQRVQVSVGGLNLSSSMTQEQHFGPLKYYSNFSLLMEGLTVHIPNPDTSLPGVNAGDTVQRAFDSIGPNWSRKKSRALPTHILAGIPFTLGDVKLAAGVGFVEYANLDQYYQNNNVLSPSILSERPLPTPRPPNDSVPTIVQWSQFLRSREGSLRGYGAAISGAVSNEVSLAVNGLVLRGKTDDVEQSVSRGRMVFYTNFFRLDSTYRRTSRVGTSEFRGFEFSLGGIFRGRHVTVGFVVKPPSTITREYSGQLSIDSTGGSLRTTQNTTDEIQLPWRGNVGIAIVPVEQVTLGFEYELRPYSSADYKDGTGKETNPWLSSSGVRIGLDYRAADWLSLRAGLRDQSEIFEPEGNALIGESVSYSVYSAGAGFRVANIRLNIAYEYAKMKYEDVWGSAVSLNGDAHHAWIADIAYELP